MPGKYPDFETESVGSLIAVNEELKRKASLHVSAYAIKQDDPQTVATELLDMLGFLEDRPLRSTRRKPRGGKV